MQKIDIKPPWSVDPDLSPPDGPDKPPVGMSMLEPKYHDAYQTWASQKSPWSAGKLLTAVDPILDEAARSYAGGEAGSATTKAHAKRLALEAFDRYDPDRAKLKTHLLSHLRGLRRITQRATAAGYAPEQSRLDSQRLSSARPELMETLGRHPSDAELSDHTGISIDRIARARKIPGVLSSGQAGESVGVSRPDQAAYDQWVNAIYHDSDPTDQLILEKSLGLNGHEILPAQDIAKMLGLSSGSISQKKSRLQKQLDEYETFMGRT